MGKTIKGKERTARKIAAVRRKIARKCKGGKCVAVVAAFALAFLLAGCATSDSAQPAKSQTQSNEFKGCTFIMASKASVSNGVIVAEGDSAPALEMFTQTQSLESTGSTETISPSSTQTPTTDVKPDIDVHYNDPVSTGGKAATSVFDALTSESAALLKSYITGKKSGSVTVTKKDGTTETLQCKDGSCTISGQTITATDCASCKDCASCSDK